MERQVENIQANTNGRIGTVPDNDGIISRKPLNVLIARKLPEIGASSLVFETVVQHVQEINDRWFQDEQPLLTKERIEQLKASFFGIEKLSKRLSLEEAYGVMFTEAEREHLTYEYFLEDWEAFQQEEQTTKEEDGEINSTAIMTFDLALSFLRANQ
eukprot:CAMPEP_0197266580 /NCGR_PEP_ID=MMETSP1432-20130617/3089_1 /TAXON_ID=44447 /ORGANISM="Pseudo-nitzschia delicatissima, Strain UNC1205" /LENGTH=156 /DNA_ID=CAMNT_0042731467 /DNA_START=118 /DNA_END=588 /DNA_ORIENTATION=-